MRESLSPAKFGRKTMGGVSYKEVDETMGLLESESSEDEDEEVRLINGFDTGLPLSDQVKLNLSGKYTCFFAALTNNTNYNTRICAGYPNILYYK